MASLSMTLSFLAFTLMLTFFTLSSLSTEQTYFERNQDKWDIQMTVKNTALADVSGSDWLKEIREQPGVRNVAVYQKAWALCSLSEADLSDEVLARGGLPLDRAADGTWQVNAMLLILEDDSFQTYCQQIGAEPSLEGTVLLNRIRDFADPNFRDRGTVPYLKDGRQSLDLISAAEGGTAVTLPVFFSTEQAPVLREAWQDEDPCELVQILPLSLWQTVRNSLQGEEPDFSIRILAPEGVTGEELQEQETLFRGLLPETIQAESENRIQEKETNDDMIRGMMLLFGSFCVLLALIGVSSVFGNTLGFVRMRRREFARYLSLGVTPEGMRKIFFVEVLTLTGRPILWTLLLTAIFTAGMLKMSYMSPAVFLAHLPVLPVAVFLFSVVFLISLAYIIGGRALLRIDLASVLRDETMI